MPLGAQHRALEARLQRPNDAPFADRPARVLLRRVATRDLAFTLLLADGRVVHRRGVTDVPGLYFLGLSWQHTRGSALLGFVDADAAHLADRIVEHAATRAQAGSAQQPAADQDPAARHQIA